MDERQGAKPPVRREGWDAQEWLPRKSRTPEEVAALREALLDARIERIRAREFS